MSQTMDAMGRPLFFPASMDLDDEGAVIPRPMAELKPFAEAIAPHEILPFVRRLINTASRRKRQPKWAAVNRQRLELARLCIEGPYLSASAKLETLPPARHRSGGILMQRSIRPLQRCHTPIPPAQRCPCIRRIFSSRASKCPPSQD